MPGSAYYKIAVQVSVLLSVVEECKINPSTKEIADMLNNVSMDNDEEIVSFDVKSLYTNTIPVVEVINECTILLHSGRYKKPPVSEATIKELLTVCCCNVIMLTNDGY